MIKKIKNHHATCTTFTDVIKTWSTYVGKDHVSYVGFLNKHTLYKSPYFKTQIKGHLTTYILK